LPTRTVFHVHMAGYWLKFSTSNNRTSDEPHWLRYRHCAKLIISTFRGLFMLFRGLGWRADARRAASALAESSTVQKSSEPSTASASDLRVTTLRYSERWKLDTGVRPPDFGTPVGRSKEVARLVHSVGRRQYCRGDRSRWVDRYFDGDGRMHAVPSSRRSHWQVGRELIPE